MTTTLYGVLWSSLGLAAYFGLCEWWAHQPRLPEAVYLCVTLWPFLAIALGRIWGLRVLHVLAVAVGAALFAAMWSLTLVDFPPPAVQSLPTGIWWLLLLAPVVLTPIVGLSWGSRGTLMATLMVALAHPGLLPIQMWNSNIHVTGGWREYPFPSFLGEIVILAVTIPIGFGGGFLGSRLRRRLSVLRASRPMPGQPA